MNIESFIRIFSLVLTVSTFSLSLVILWKILKKQFPIITKPKEDDEEVSIDPDRVTVSISLQKQVWEFPEISGEYQHISPVRSQHHCFRLRAGPLFHQHKFPAVMIVARL